MDRRAGFTLIELLVVVAIIALIALFTLPKVGSLLKASLNSTARNMASIVKETYNSTVMTGKVSRLVYDLKNGEYWVETGPPTVLLDTGESKERDAHRKRFALSTDKDKEPPSPFTLDRTVTRKKISLPTGVDFEDVITEQSPEPIKEGIAYTHFFPHGITEQTIVHLKDNSQHHMTLVISALIGQTHVIERYVKGEEAYNE